MPVVSAIIPKLYENSCDCMLIIYFHFHAVYYTYNHTRLAHQMNKVFVERLVFSFLFFSISRCNSPLFMRLNSLQLERRGSSVCSLLALSTMAVKLHQKFVQKDSQCSQTLLCPLRRL